MSGPAGKILLAMTGGSGAPYGRRLMEVLLDLGKEVSLIVSEPGWRVIESELDRKEFQRWLEDKPICRYDPKDVGAKVASGSSAPDAMVICPCSTGTLGRIANGVSMNLVDRAADVMLKERRKLILVPRETPYHLIHLRNMTQVTEAGAIVLPASPGFYHRPQSVNDLVNFVAGKILDQLSIEHYISKKWSPEN